MIERLLSWINSTPPDKVLHFVGGVVLYALALPFAGPRYSLAVVAAAAIAKEIYDSRRRQSHTPDVYDAIATISGGILGWVIREVA